MRNLQHGIPEQEIHNIRTPEKRWEIGRGGISKGIQAAKDLLPAQKRYAVINKFPAGLTSAQPAKIFELKPDKVDVTSIPMLTFRYITLGGKFIASPTLYPHEEWIKYQHER